MSISYLWKLSQFPEKVECAIHFRRWAGSFIGIEKCDTSQLARKYIFCSLPKENDHLVAFFLPPRLVFGEYRAKSIASACRQLWCFCQSKKIADTRGIFLYLLFSRWFCRVLPSRVENGVGGEIRELGNWRKSSIFIQFVELLLKHRQRHNGHKGWVLSPR